MLHNVTFLMIFYMHTLILSFLMPVFTTLISDLVPVCILVFCSWYCQPTYFIVKSTDTLLKALSSLTHN